ncbi:MAG: hypothetical protein IH804_09745 [Planctomycetes bacterium]|nr:hypothetical protein [Planctomycetota bacterium]
MCQLGLFVQVESDEHCDQLDVAFTVANMYVPIATESFTAPFSTRTSSPRSWGRTAKWGAPVTCVQCHGGSPTETDLAEARTEAWLNGFLRRGHPDLPLEAVTTRLAPVVREGRCLGFLLRAESPGADASAPGWYPWVDSRGTRRSPMRC